MHRRTRTTLTTLPALAAALALTLTGCGAEDDDHGTTHETRTAVNGDKINDADVAFATDMIQHHAQALAMVDLTVGRDLDPEFVALADQIRAAQSPEIEQMTTWLTDWEEPVPETVRDHANSHGDDHGDAEGDDHADMPGMMSADEMAELEAAQGAEFRDLWLEMMIEHHEGAVEMSEDELDNGVFDPAKELAEAIIEAQEAEIEQMEQMRS